MKYEHGGTIYNIAREHGLKPNDLLDFSANINPLGYSKRVKKILADLDHEILNYPEQQSYNLITELSLYHNIAPETILAGNGSTEFIFLLPRVLRPKKVLLVVPTFSEYEKSIKQTAGRVFYLKMKENEAFTINKINLIEKLQEGYDALYICNPGNPTGVLTSKEILKNVISAARKLSTAVIIDETFIDFNEQQSLKFEINMFKNLYILRSMTKFFALPGLRAGYVISCAENINKLRAMQEPWTMNVAAQYAGIASLKDTAYIRQTRDYVTSARQHLIEDLQEIQGIKIFPGAANYLLLKLTENAPIDVNKLYNELLKKLIIIRKCHNFQDMGERFFRIAVKKKSENKRLVSELKKILT